MDKIDLNLEKEEFINRMKEESDKLIKALEGNTLSNAKRLLEYTIGRLQRKATV